jgi:hypothetical protein
MNAYGKCARGGGWIFVATIFCASHALSDQPVADRCTADSKPVACYEAELRSLGKVRGQLQHDAEDAKAIVAIKDGEINRLHTQLAAASIPNPAYQFLIGTWCDEAIAGAQPVKQSVFRMNGRDVLVSDGPAGVTAAHLLSAPVNEWEVAMATRNGPNASLVKVTTHGKKLNDDRLQYTISQTVLVPSPVPSPFPPPPPFTGTLARCN